MLLVKSGLMMILWFYSLSVIASVAVAFATPRCNICRPMLNHFLNEIMTGARPSDTAFMQQELQLKPSVAILDFAQAKSEPLFSTRNHSVPGSPSLDFGADLRHEYSPTAILPGTLYFRSTRCRPASASPQARYIYRAKSPRPATSPRKTSPCSFISHKPSDRVSCQLQDTVATPKYARTRPASAGALRTRGLLQISPQLYARSLVPEGAQKLSPYSSPAQLTLQRRLAVSRHDDTNDGTDARPGVKGGSGTRPSSAKRCHAPTWSPCTVPHKASITRGQHSKQSAKLQTDQALEAEMRERGAGGRHSPESMSLPAEMRLREHTLGNVDMVLSFEYCLSSCLASCGTFPFA